MQTKLKDIFDHISENEDHVFEVNQQYLNKTKVQIETMNGYVDVVSMMSKEDIKALPFRNENIDPSIFNL